MSIGWRRWRRGLLVLDANRFLGAAARAATRDSVSSPWDSRRHEPAARRSQRHHHGRQPGAGPGHRRRPTLRPAQACCMCARDEAQLLEARAASRMPAQARPVSRSRPSAPMSRARRTSQALAAQRLRDVSAGARPREQRRRLRPAWARARRSTGTRGCERWRSTSTAPCCRAGRSCRISRRTATGRSSSSRAAAPPTRCPASAPTLPRRPRSSDSPSRSRSRSGQFGIDVNAIAPGALNTRMLDEVLAAGPDAVGRDFHERMVTDQGAGRNAARARRGAGGLSRIRRERRHHRPLLSAVWDPWEDLASRRDDLDGTRRLHAAPDRSEGPRLRRGANGESWSRRGHRRLRADRPQARRRARGARGLSRAPMRCQSAPPHWPASCRSGRACHRLARRRRQIPTSISSSSQRRTMR